jgi:hypothetical protein
VALAQKSAKELAAEVMRTFEPPHRVFEPFLPILNLALPNSFLYKRGLTGISARAKKALQPSP